MTEESHLSQHFVLTCSTPETHKEVKTHSTGLSDPTDIPEYPGQLVSKGDGAKPSPRESVKVAASAGPCVCVRLCVSASVCVSECMCVLLWNQSVCACALCTACYVRRYVAKGREKAHGAQEREHSVHSVSMTPSGQQSHIFLNLL